MGGAWPAWAWVLLVALAQLTFGRAHRKSRQALLISIPCLDSCGLSASVLCALLPRRGAAIRSHPVTHTVPLHPPAISVYHSQQSDGELLVLDYDMSYSNKTPSATWPKTLSPSGVAPFRTAWLMKRPRPVLTLCRSARYCIVLVSPRPSKAHESQTQPRDRSLLQSDSSHIHISRRVAYTHAYIDKMSGQFCRS